MYSILKDHCSGNRTQWNEQKAQRSAQDAYERMFTFKWLPPGRGIWMMGTEFVNGRKNSAPLQNCAFISTEKVSVHSKAEATLPFMRLMEMSMLGVGVGFDTKGSDKITLHEPDHDRKEFRIVADTREGWYESLGDLLWSYFNGGPWLEFDYGQVRPAGELIKGFGGVAAGPDPLIRLHDDLRRILGGREGHKLGSSDIVDICNLIGKCVVSGNVRRSAELALGEADDDDFLDLKNYEVNPDRMGADGWGHASNNSVAAVVGGNYDHLIDRIVTNGEPGLVYLDVCREHGRLVDPINNKDHRVMGVNPCLTLDAWIMTAEGPKRAGDLVGEGREKYLLHGELHSGTQFFKTGTDRQVWRLRTSEGYELRVTDNHQINTTRGWVEAKDLVSGDQIVLGNNEHTTWGDPTSAEVGYLLGLLLGDGCIHPVAGATLSVWDADSGSEEVRNRAQGILASLPHRSDWQGFTPVKDRGEWRARSASFTQVAAEYGMVNGNKHISDQIERESSYFYEEFLRGLFDADGCVEGHSTGGGVSIRLTQSHLGDAQAVQRMLLRLGIKSTLSKMRDAGEHTLPNGKGDTAVYPIKEQWRVIVSGSYTEIFMRRIGFGNPDKAAKYADRTSSMKRGFYSKPHIAIFESLTPDGVEDVYDITVDVVHAFEANGLVVHNCAEQTLESYECCTLVESFPIKHDDLDDYLKTLKVAYLYGKAVTLLPTHWPEVNEVMQRNRRIGCSVSGSAQFAETHGWTELRNWLDKGYEEIVRRDHQYSEWLGVRESIKMTSVKPSGSVSLLAGVTPGVHWPTSDIYIRRMRLSINDPLVGVLRKAGYHVEPDVMNPEFDMVVELPTKGPDVRTEKDVSVWEKAALAVAHQRYWADNAVSVTLTFSDAERDQIGPVIRAFEGQLKTLSFLPSMEEGAYAQMPYERIGLDDYNNKVSGVKYLDWSRLYDGDSLDAVGEAYCTTDKCEVKFS